MTRLTIEEIGVHGNRLAPRSRWFCPNCFPRFKLQDPFWQMLDRSEKARRAEEEARYRDGKARWAQEQERRRLENLKNKK
ncbi:MAG: hypothetical protein R3D78_02870 [Paracoccaceae bacterium]|jgi:hypothetical protein